MIALDTKQLGRFFRYELMSRRQDLLLPLVLPAALYVVATLLALAANMPTQAWPDGTFKLALALGAVAAAYAHRRETEAATAAFEMQLPVAPLDRFATRLFATLVVPFLGQLLALTLLANFAAAASRLLGLIPAWPGLLLPNAPMLVQALGVFLLCHSVLFAGGAFFRGSPIIKSALALCAYGAILAVFWLGAGAFAVARVISASPSRFDIEAVVNGFNAVGPWLQSAWFLAFPLLLYLATFYRMVENEERG